MGSEHLPFHFPFGGSGRVSEDSYQKLYEKYGSSVFNGVSYFTEAKSDDFRRLVPSKDFSLYIHFPFCESICRDCPYNRIVQKDLVGGYCRGLKREIELIVNNWSDRSMTISTVYLGGGTPSIIPIHLLKDIMQDIDREFIRGANPQVTIECNPTSLTLQKLDAYKEMGINRLSIGIQSFYDEILKEMNRSHTGAQCANAVRQVKEKGFNFNVDLIYGFDCQSKQMFLSDVKRAMDSDADHITIYALIRKQDTHLAAEMEKKQHEMFNAAYEMLMEDGFMQQNAHSFGRTPESLNRYEQDLWKEPLKDIVGLGSSAFGRTSKVYYLKHHRVKKYIRCLEREVPPLHFFGA